MEIIKHFVISALMPPLLAFTLPVCPSRSAPPGLVVWGQVGVFLLFRRFLGAKWEGWLGRCLQVGGSAEI